MESSSLSFYLGIRFNTNRPHLKVFHGYVLVSSPRSRDVLRELLDLTRAQRSIQIAPHLMALVEKGHMKFENYAMRSPVWDRATYFYLECIELYIINISYTDTANTHVKMKRPTMYFVCMTY